MGAKTSTSRVAVYQDWFSPSQPSETSVLSEPLEDLTSFEELFPVLVELIRHSPSELRAALPSSSVLKDVSPTEFWLLDSMPSDGNTDATEMATHVRLNTGTGEISIMLFRDTGQERVKENTTCVKLHREPLYLEAWGFVPGRRSADVPSLKFDALLHGACRAISSLVDCNAHVNCDVPSPSGSGLLSAVSEPLDEWVDGATAHEKAVALFDRLVAVVRAPVLSEILKSSSVVATSEVGFTLRQVIHGPYVGAPRDVILLLIVTADRKSLHVAVEIRTESGALQATRHHVVHPGPPLLLEDWVEVPNRRQPRTPYRGCEKARVESLLAELFGFRGAPRAFLSPDADSPSGGRQKSILSTALDALIDYDALFEAVVRCLKEIVGERTVHAESTAEAWTISTESGVTQVGSADKACGLITSKMLRGETEVGTGHFRIHREPLVVEYWFVEAGGIRRSNFAHCVAIQNGVINKIFGFYGAGAIDLQFDQESPLQPGRKSILSGDLKAVTSAEYLWKRLLLSVVDKSAEALPEGITYAEVRSFRESSSESLEICSASVLRQHGVGNGRDDQGVSNFVSIDEDSKQIVSTRYKATDPYAGTVHGQILGTSTIKLHNKADRLEVEMWSTGIEKRLSGPLIRAWVQLQLDTALDRTLGKQISGQETGIVTNLTPQAAVQEI